MTISYVNHVDVGLERPVTYFKDKENFIYLLEIFLKELQEIEDALVELSHMKDLSSVTGIWLDYIGKIVGESRLSRNDEDYRAAISLRIAINTSDGTAPVIYEIVKTYTTSDIVRISEGILSWGQFIFNGKKSADSTLWALLENIKPVTAASIIMQDTNDTSLFPAWEIRISSVELFEVFDGSVTETLELVLSESVSPVPLYVSSFGETTSYDPETTDNYIPEWEELEDFRIHTGELLELQVAPLQVEVLQVTPVAEAFYPTTLLPWEINEKTNISIPPAPDTVILTERVLQGETLTLDLTEYGSPVYKAGQQELGFVEVIPEYTVKYQAFSSGNGVDRLTILLENEGIVYVNLLVGDVDYTLNLTTEYETPVLADVGFTGSTINTYSDPSYGIVDQQSSTTLLYTPNTEYYGLDDFTIKLEDNEDVKVNITVNNEKFTLDLVTEYETPLLVDVSFTGSTIDTYSAPLYGSLVKQSSTTLLYTPDTGYNGLDDFSVTLENTGIVYVGVEVLEEEISSYAGVQIGQAIITPEEVWTDNENNHVFDLLLADGSSFNAGSYPILATKYPSLVLPNLPTETGSPFPYKIVADIALPPTADWGGSADWDIMINGSNWLTPTHAEFPESFVGGTANPLLKTKDINGIQGSSGKSVEIDIIVDSENFDDNYWSFSGITYKSKDNQTISGNVRFKGNIATYDGNDIVGELQQDGRYNFTVHFDGMLLTDDLVEVSTHQNFNYFGFDIVDMRFK